ncbi:hypothetical protein M3E18_03520 [Kocuria sp. p3-SID1433]|uniref:hypothetical protein n=1 Tax=unclassified Kocuria TaxID=2649579 RepID=UPI0021A62E63|nr:MULTISPECIES: hypothetical protein [unclassified Kocuria]MCT1602129.1 hypothetical protein [Kocuria sp. p3-SID1428]MCT2179616.1 hypothetical protein [Kocuria sp. p3-SID1433]
MSPDPLGGAPGAVALDGLSWSLHGTDPGAIGWAGPWEQAEAPVLREGERSVLKARLEELSQLSLPASVPGTLAAALRDAGREPVTQPDDRDWWWRADLELPADEPEWQWELRLRGVATVSEVWWDGRRVVVSASGLDDVVVRLSAAPGRHELAIVCRALSLLPVPRRPRGRWRSSLVADQSLRWRRTPLIGRIPWAGTAPVIGPWGQASLLPVPEHGIELTGVRTELDRDLRRAEVIVGYRAERAGHLELSCAEAATAAEVPAGEGQLRLEVRDPALWWPATHGEPALHELTVRAGSEPARLQPLTRRSVGFRRLEARTDDGGFRLVVNGRPVFARGAVWAPVDPLSLAGSAREIERTVRAMAAAGANILRISGTGAWESPAFYGACDRLGVMVWQDAMLATLDPPEDPEWLGLLEAELRTWLPRLGAHPSLAVVSGGNEVLQQPVLWGRSPQEMAMTAIDELIPALCAQLIPQAVHVPTSPCGGRPPTRPDEGISHWFGVGAYRRPLTDARLSGVRFAAEALAFGCPPRPEAIEADFGSATADHDETARAAWSAAAARDPGAGWDFEDIAAHYAKRWIAPGIEADRGATGAVADHPGDGEWGGLERDEQLRLERAASARAVERTLVDLRRPGSRCDGVIILAARDLVPGAGWGLLDSEGLPKATWYAMRRACAPVAVLLTDEGLAGLHAHVVCDRPLQLRGRLRLRVWTRQGVLSHEAHPEVSIDGPGSVTFVVEDELGGFLDLDRNWGFGARQWEALAVELQVTSDSDPVGTDAVLETVRLLGGASRDVLADLRTAPELGRQDDDSSYELRPAKPGYRDGNGLSSLRSDISAAAVGVPCAEGLVPQDEGFDLPPGGRRDIELVEAGSWPPVVVPGRTASGD